MPADPRRRRDALGLAVEALSLPATALVVIAVVVSYALAWSGAPRWVALAPVRVVAGAAGVVVLGLALWCVARWLPILGVAAGLALCALAAIPARAVRRRAAGGPPTPTPPPPRGITLGRRTPDPAAAAHRRRGAGPRPGDRRRPAAP